MASMRRQRWWTTRCICGDTNRCIASPGDRLIQALVVVFVGSLLYPVSLAAQVNPVNDFFGGFSVLAIGDETTDSPRHIPVGWQLSVSQKIKSAVEAAKKDT